MELIYQNTDRIKNMTDTIRDTANQWKNNNPENTNEIVEQIIDNINLQEIITLNKNLKHRIELST